VIYELDDLKQGFEVSADAVVVGTGAGGPVAAANLARAGMKVVIIEAGPVVRPEDMRQDPPSFLAKYYWEGGMRLLGGSAQIPTMQGRCLGGSTVVNSAIMLPLHDWVRAEWATETGIEMFQSAALDEAYARVFEATKTAPTPLSVMGRRNEIVRDALAASGIKGVPLPRAVHGCSGSGHCITGCSSGAKQSTDRSYIPTALAHGATVYTSSVAERVLLENGRAAGIAGSIVDPDGHVRRGRFVVRAPLVVVAAGPMQTPVLLQDSGINPRGRVGATLFAHVGGGIVGVMDEVVEPWKGATQGWGAISEEIRGLKFESLWAAPSLIMVRYGDVGRRYLEVMRDIRNAAVMAIVYRAKVTGSVKSKGNGMPRMRVWIPDSEMHVALRGIKIACDSLLKVGARFVYTGIPGTKSEMKNEEDTSAHLDKKLSAKHVGMTANHVFGSCRMSKKDDGAVDEHGQVRGVENLYLADASIFPSPSGVNPQATIMALADIISRRLGELRA
jgi:choline dehydrogenase-like flavoprotein